MARTEYVQVAAEIMRVGEKAVRIRRENHDGSTEPPEWVPLSQIRDPETLDEGVSDIIEVARWLAADRAWDCA